VLATQGFGNGVMQGDVAAIVTGGYSYYYEVSVVVAPTSPSGPGGGRWRRGGPQGGPTYTSEPEEEQVKQHPKTRLFHRSHKAKTNAQSQKQSAKSHENPEYIVRKTLVKELDREQLLARMVQEDEELIAIAISVVRIINGSRYPAD